MNRFGEIGFDIGCRDLSADDVERLLAQIQKSSFEMINVEIWVNRETIDREFCRELLNEVMVGDEWLMIFIRCVKWIESPRFGKFDLPLTLRIGREGPPGNELRADILSREGRWHCALVTTQLQLEVGVFEGEEYIRAINELVLITLRALNSPSAVISDDPDGQTLYVCKINGEGFPDPDVLHAEEVEQMRQIGFPNPEARLAEEFERAYRHHAYKPVNKSQ